jgi:hypothetical protein
MLQTTQKSVSLSSIIPRIFANLAPYRVLLVLIRDMGNLPCPQCLVLKLDLGDLGKQRDRKIHEQSAGVDDDIRRFNVKLAQDRIYECGVGVTSVHIDVILKLQSLVPTIVHESYFHPSSYF